MARPQMSIHVVQGEARTGAGPLFAGAFCAAWYSGVTGGQAHIRAHLPVDADGLLSVTKRWKNPTGVEASIQVGHRPTV